jgi:alpha-glucosidase
MSATQPWWQSSVIYQIYPRSFQDSNADGIGDLPGITARLDYLQRLGVDAIWLSPIYPSPMADFGYDVADYVDIDPMFGTLADFDRLVAAAHARNVRVILDLVPNHSSDEHPWFVQSRRSRDNPYRDWYIWRDPAPDGGPPNNWQSNFGGPAWTFDETTGQYYLHLFDPKQPDLNWRNPAVVAAIHDAMRFWFRRGIDGFRIDVIWMLIKHSDFPDNPPNPEWKPGDPTQWRHIRVYDQHQPDVHDVIRGLRRVADEFGDTVLIGEIYMPPEELVRYYGADHDGVQLPYNFNLVTLPTWDAPSVRAMVERYEAALPTGAWPNYVLGNHDQSRTATRVGPERARTAQMLLLTLRGTPTLYYGEEIGIEDVPIPQALVVDPQGLRTPGMTRDVARTPMQWDGTPGAGFSGARAWLPLAADAPVRNVAAQEADPQSLLFLTRRLLELRRALPALQRGSYTTVPTTADAEVFAYRRGDAADGCLIVLNFGPTAYTLDLSAVAATATIVCATGLDREGAADLAALELRPYEGLLLRL